MSESEVTAGLVEHASGSSAADGDGLADALWRRRTHGETIEVPVLWAQLVLLLQALNDLGVDSVDAPTFRRQSYAVSEMLSALAYEALADDRPQVTELKVLMWHLACAWEAILAGDEADIAEHARFEAVARGIGPL